MKLKNIKKFPFCQYKINVSWYDLNFVLDRYIERFNLNLNPEYQRGYVWTKKQKIAYIEYCLKGGFSGKDIYFNCPDWLGDNMGIMELVDGQQRIKTVIDFLDNKVKAFGLYLNEYEDRLNSLDPDFVFHINKLTSKKEVVKWYIGFNTGGSIHTEEDLKSAYDYLEKIQKENEDD